MAALAVEANWLAAGITGLINVFDPDTVVLGGLFSRILPIARRAAPTPNSLQLRYMGVRRDVAVVGAALGPQAVTVGAAELAFGALLGDPARVMRGVAGQRGRLIADLRARTLDPVLDIGDCR